MVPAFVHFKYFIIMIKYNFQLRKDKVPQDDLMPIRLLFRIDSAIIKRNTGLNCKLEDWQNTELKQILKRMNITAMMKSMKNYRK